MKRKIESEIETVEQQYQVNQADIAKINRLLDQKTRESLIIQGRHQALKTLLNYHKNKYGKKSNSKSRGHPQRNSQAE